MNIDFARNWHVIVSALFTPLFERIWIFQLFFFCLMIIIFLVKNRVPCFLFANIWSPMNRVEALPLTSHNCSLSIKTSIPVSKQSDKRGLKENPFKALG